VLAVRILSALPFFVLVAIIDGIIVFDRVKRKQVSTDELHQAITVTVGRSDDFAKNSSLHLLL
jgi:hypothetical protein